MLVHITKCNYKEETNQWGRKTWKTGILTAEFGDTWLNGWLPFCPDRWEGKQQDLLIEDKEVNGKTYKNFKLPPKEEKTEGTGKIAFSLQHMHNKLDRMQEDLNNLRAFIVEKKPIPVEPSKRDYPTGAKEGIDPAKAGEQWEVSESEMEALARESGF